MADEFVRKDVFDARMDRMEAILDKKLEEFRGELKNMNERMDKNLAEMKAIVADIRGDIGVLNTRMNGMDTRISDLQTVVYWGFAIIGFVLAFASFAPALTELIKNFRKQALTVENVKLLISETLNSKEAKV